MTTPLDQFKTYRNAVRYADEERSKQLVEINKRIRDRVERAEAERRHQQELHDQRERERRQLIHARDNTVNVVQSQANACSQLAQEIEGMKNRLANNGKYRRSIRIRAIITLVLAFMLICVFAAFTEDPDAIGGVFLFLVGLIFAGRSLAVFRGKSGGLAIFLGLITYGIYPTVTAILALLSVRKKKEAALVDQLREMETQLQQMNVSLDQSRQALSELNQRLEAF